jgi:hypothetical protein
MIPGDGDRHHMDNGVMKNLDDRIETIESGYEYMLAYAAQGHEAEKDSRHEHDIRTHLENMDDALDGLGSLVIAVAEDNDNQLVNDYRAFLDAVDNDAARAQGAIRLVLARPGISSQLIDNLNATIHLRALLTDLFVIDEAFKSRGQST